MTRMPWWRQSGWVLAWALLLASGASAQDSDTLRVPGLHEPVEVVTDEWGINHIYARNEPDLFFAQGYNAARDRLFQFEIWRRQATGTVAEILGPRELKRDIGTRLFMFRGNLDQELNYYHPRGKEIITSFVDGVNAYIAETERDPDLLPLEFRLLGIRPGRWTPAVVISRHQGLLGNIGSELTYGRAVARIGPEKLLEIENFEPGDPDVSLDPAINGELLYQDILELYNAFRRPIRFERSDIVAAHRGSPEQFERLAAVTEADEERLAWQGRRDIGSNNWVVSGRLTESGFPIMANDPHRAQSAPSLRYWAHLVAPGWNVIGGGEPVLPGISIGHNEYGAWGLTVFSTDGEDLYVYETNPENPDQYRYRGNWEDMRVIRETISVRGAPAETVELKYTRHGPVVHEDRQNGKAYAVRAAWMEIGGAPYLASLRMDQARTWEEFREACAYSHIPGENMIWADREGNIGWQAVGIAPIRPNWSGLVPVPGDGRYEWAGYLPIKAKPHVLNPEQGFFATANNNLIPEGYPYREAVGWEWSDPYRWARINEVLASGRRFSMMDMMKLQTDELAIPARTLVPLLADLRAGDRQAEQARQRLLGWDHVLDKNSIPAAIYVAWERRLQDNVAEMFIPDEVDDVLRGVSTERMIEWLLAPDGHFGDNPLAGRDALLIRSLEQAVGDLRTQIGPDMERWQYGQERFKHALIRHPLSGAVSEEVRRQLDVGPLPRGGYGHTPNSTGGGNNQTSGASFRIIADVGDWDQAVGTNTPGQSGDPASPHYRNLFETWALNRFFPAFYSRDKVNSVAEETTVLLPGGAGRPTRQ
jgi:penicillin amidase